MSAATIQIALKSIPFIESFMIGFEGSHGLYSAGAKTSGQLEEGKSLYQQHFEHCYGTDGNGRGGWQVIFITL